MTLLIAPWYRPDHQATDRTAAVILIAFADERALDASSTLELGGVLPDGAPIHALDLRVHRYADSPAWIDTWRTGQMRNIAAGQLDDLAELDAAAGCVSAVVEVTDPTDLTHLQLVWAVALGLAKAGSSPILDAHAFNWFAGPTVAARRPDRPFTIGQEISVIAETEPTDGFGHPVHTRGMIKFARPDLIAGVLPQHIASTGQVLNHLGQMLVDGQVLRPGQTLRIDGDRT